MEWFKEISSLIASLAWPAVVMTLAIMFRREVQGLIGAIKEVKYPGGSITVEVDKLQAKVEKAALVTEQALSIEAPTDSIRIAHVDPQLAIAQLRTDLEKELFRLSWRTLDIDEIKGWTVERHVDELQSSKVLPANTSENVRMYFRIANSVIHGMKIDDETKTKLASVGASLIAQLHYERKVLEMAKDFEGHGLWHMHKHLSGDGLKYYFWSAVAASLPEFEFNFDIYKDAADRYTRKEEEQRRERDRLYVLPLSEFVKVLEFRETELLRLIGVWHKHEGDTWKAFEKANYWKWPVEWGDLGWNCPIIRERLSLYAAEDDLMQTRTALNRYRMRLIASIPESKQVPLSLGNDARGAQRIRLDRAQPRSEPFVGRARS